MKPTSSMRGYKSFYMLSPTQVEDILGGVMKEKAGACKKVFFESDVVQRFLKSYTIENDVILGGSHPFVRCLGATTPNEGATYIYVTNDTEAAHWQKTPDAIEPIEVLSRNDIIVNIYTSPEGDFLCLYSCSDVPNFCLAHLTLGEEEE
eukprot:TRINITY_DN23994_c0_g1_i1.p1 TRINITY_DN23994_c0_g1~~TRINITY_DN23994_c0_g1_i1.p1  ORF type:complete len:168 (+),score=38.97 TRINITY_DN23994_c0_g1_i1:59-505(+)